VEQDLELVDKFLTKHCSNYLCCREEAAHSHVHVYGRSTLKFKGFQSAVRRSFPEHIGNGGYSLKECDAEVYDYLKYICKGEGEGQYPDIICRQGLEYSDEKIVELHEAYWCTNAVLLENSKKRDNLKLKGNIVERIEKEAKQLGLLGHDREEVAKLYCKMYVDARKPVNVYHAKGVVNTVCALLSGHSFDLLVSDCAQR